MRALTLLPLLIGSIYAVISRAPVERLALLFVVDALFLAMLVSIGMLFGWVKLRGGLSFGLRAGVVHTMLALLAAYGFLSLYGVVLLSGGSSVSQLWPLIEGSLTSVFLVLGLRLVSFLVGLKQALPATSASQCMVQLMAPLVAYLWVFLLAELGVSAPQVSTGLFGVSIILFAYCAPDIAQKWPVMGQYLREEQKPL